jgi:cysteine desulfurase
MKEIYFDNGATTPAFPEVVDIMQELLRESYGNPSSMHKKGFEAEQYIKQAKDIIAKSIKADPEEIFFTSGGTEGNNLALIGTALAGRRRRNHIISSCIEHASVYNPLSFFGG